MLGRVHRVKQGTVYLLCGIPQALKSTPRHVLAGHWSTGERRRKVLHSHLDCSRPSCIGTAGLLAH